jgi:hypothetical protein
VFLEPIVITCGHTFCHFCILEWTTQNYNCPICHKEIPASCNSGLYKLVQIDNFIAKIYNALGGNYLLTRLQLQNARAEKRYTSSSYFPQEASKQINVAQKPLKSTVYHEEADAFSVVNQHLNECIPHAEYAEKLSEFPTNSEDVRISSAHSELARRSNARTMASVSISTSISNNAPVRYRGISSRTGRISPSEPISFRDQPTSMWITWMLTILFLIVISCGYLYFCVAWYKQATGQAGKKWF